MNASVPSLRIQTCNSAPLAASGEWVVYWMVAARRGHWNFGLQRAVEHAARLQKPLVVFEPLRCDYRWASVRLHRFVLEGMAANRAHFANTTATYFPYVEPTRGADHGLLAALAKRACVVVTDEFPTFFLPRMLSQIAHQLPVRLEAVDSNGLLPLRATDDVFPTAYAFRRFLQKNLPPHLEQFPAADPLAGVSLPPVGPALAKLQKQWPAASQTLLTASPAALQTLPIDQAVGPALMQGGASVAEQTLQRFLAQRLAQYAEDRNQPEREVASGLSPYLHFGHLSVHQVFQQIRELENWTPNQLAMKATGSREGWWNMSPAAESFLDECITWREVGYNFCSKRNDYYLFDSLPDWAKSTLLKHTRDPRPVTYELAEFAAGKTHDRLWNAAQLQLVQEGRMHNYLRMLWGKKILEWSATPEAALGILIELNNRYAVDGRNPNSYSGIFWTLGRYDRPWGPERPIFGTIRYMSSDNTARKVRVKEYVQRYAPEPNSGRTLF